MYFFLIDLDKTRIDPHELKVKIGMNAEFKCHGHKIIWNFNGRVSLPDNVDLQDYGTSLNVLKANIENSGIYECNGRDAQDKLFYAFGRLIVIGVL